MLVVLRRGLVEVDNELRVDAEVLKVGGQGVFQCIAVYNARMDFEKKSDDFCRFISEVVRFQKDALLVEPIDKGGVVNGVAFDL